MKNRTIIFFEISDYSLLRFPKRIAEEYCRNNLDVQFVFAYLYKYSQENINFKIFPKNSHFTYLRGNISKIDTIFLNYPQATVFTFALRPPEFYLVNSAKKMELKTIILQHGVLIPFMKRNVSYFVKEGKKMFFYFKSILLLSLKTKMSSLKCFREVFSIYILGSKKLSQSVFVKKLNVLPDSVYVYSKYWKDFFILNYGFSPNQFNCIGSPDLEIYDSIITQKREDAVCYICQTLVEDGRLSKRDFLLFINAFGNSLKPTHDLYLKLHPRSELELYQQLTKRKNTFLVKENTPNCTKYVGHYSTLISLPLNITANVFLWEFKGHEIPEYFSKATGYIGSSELELREFISNENEAPAFKEVLEYYFHYPGTRPFEEIYKLTEKQQIQS
ncbi:MAG: hypothetical protein AAGA43_12345 [Bacteroidota bacterium]